MLAQPERFLGADLELVADVHSTDQARVIGRDVVGARRSGPMPVALFEGSVGTDLTTMWRWLQDHALHVDLEPTRAVLPAALTVREWLERQTRAPRPT